MCLALKVKNLNFGKLVWVEPPIVKPSIFVRFSLFLICTNSENLIHLVVAVLNFKVLENPIEGDHPICHPQFQSHTSPP